MAGAVVASPKSDSAPGGDNRVLLVSGPIHYDFLLPWTARTKAAFAQVGIEPTTDATTRFMLVGWGAETFYTTVGGYADVSATAIWRGITGDRSVLRLDPIGPLRRENEWRSVTLNDVQYDLLLDAITGSFKSPEPLQIDGFTRTDQFYPAKGRFHIGRTCNVWIGEMLRAAGLRFGLWTPLPSSVSASHVLFLDGTSP